MGQFALDLAAFAAKAGDNAGQVVRKVSIDMMGRVVKRSPVDTGRFRANWTMNFGSPDLSTSADVDKTGDSTIKTQAERLAGFKIGPEVYIMNSLPYAIRLENGYSQQAPIGMVKITIAEFQTMVDEAAREVQQ